MVLELNLYLRSYTYVQLCKVNNHLVLIIDMLTSVMFIYSNIVVIMQDLMQEKNGEINNNPGFFSSQNQ